MIINKKEGVRKLGLAISLIGMTLGAKGNLIVVYVLAFIIAVDGAILIFENIRQNKQWKIITDAARGVELTYFAFGLGMLNLLGKMPEWSASWILLFAAGLVFITYNIIELIGGGGKKVIEASPEIGLFIGLGVFLGGACWILISIRDETPNINLIVEFGNLSTQIIVFFYGIMLAIFSVLKLKRNVNKPSGVV
jgi:hypothetical protein